MIFMAYEKSAYKNIYDTYEPQKSHLAMFILFFHGHVGLPYRVNGLYRKATRGERQRGQPGMWHEKLAMVNDRFMD